MEKYLNSRSEDSNYLKNILLSAKQKVDIVSITLGFVSKSELFEVVKSCLDKGIKINVMLLDPKSKFYKERNKDLGDNKLYEIKQDEIKQILQLAKEFEGLNLRLYDSYPFWHIINIDDKVIYLSHHPIGRFGFTDVKVLKIDKDDLIFDTFFDLIELIKQRSFCNEIKEFES